VQVTPGNAERVAIADLRTYHRNPRRGNVAAIRASLLVHGQYRPIVVNRGTHTGREHEVLAGNHTLLAHRELVAEEPSDANPTPERWAHVDAWVIDVDDDQAARIVAVDNRTADLGGYDDRLLLELLSELPDLDGTGYDPGDLANLEALLDDSAWDDEDGSSSRKRDGDDDRDMWPKIDLRVPPEVFDAWRLLLDQHDGKDDLAKLEALLRAEGHLE
jgi:hypothetical protein